ncbi:MAG: hypothetical protein K8R68_12315 [Bacteroidales bacterium]|nr:hypothetical protein [Bacteroidales bacterium]
MNFKIKYYLTFIFLSGLSLTKLIAQEEILLKADSLFTKMEYFEASIEYERWIFYYNSTKDYKLAKYKKALCYRYLEDYSKALAELNQISLFRISDTLITYVLYEKAINHYLSGNYLEALLNLERIPMGKNREMITNDVLPLKILAFNSTREFERARITFVDLGNSLDFNEDQKQGLLSMIDSLYTDKNLPKKYSEKKAKHLSQFIPGAGQAYTGHLGEGAVSFLVNAALLGFGIHQLYYQFYFTAYIAGFAIFYKTYQGGMRRAEYLARIESNNRMTDFNNASIRIIKQFYNQQYIK